MSQRITDRAIQELPLPENGNRIIYDSEVSGFGIRVTAGGAKSFILNYRIDGRERRYTIGAYGRNEWSVAAARKRAGELRKEISQGEDPLAVRVDKRQAPTIADLCDQYIEGYLPNKRESSQRDDKGMISGIIRPKLGSRKIEGLRRAEIKEFHRSMKGTPYRANRVLALLSTMFNFAINDLEWPLENKAKGVKRFQETKRKRYLQPDELSRLIEALKDYPEVRAAKEESRRGPKINPKTAEEARRHGKAAADVIRLCLLTGCRSGEALGARWEQFTFADDEHGNTVGEWIKLGSTTKQKTEHSAPLSDAAVVLIKDIMSSAPKDDDGELVSEFVFPGRSTKAPLSQIKYEWEYLRQKAGIDDVRVHDLRHTYASVLVSAGVSLPVIGALLGHTNPMTTARYAHLLNDPLKQATDTMGHIVTGTKSAEVTAIRKDSAK